MSWIKLENPKPLGAGSVPHDGVRFTCRQAGGRGGRPTVPWIRVQIGKDAARRGSFTRGSHKVHILVGGGDERGSLAILLDDADGKFEAKKLNDGSYAVAISQSAAAGRFETAFQAFSCPSAAVVPNGQGPAFITFAVPAAFLAPGGNA